MLLTDLRDHEIVLGKMLGSLLPILLLLLGLLPVLALIVACGVAGSVAFARSAAAPQNTAAPQISGIAKEGSTLTASTSGPIVGYGEGARWGALFYGLRYRR